MAGRLITEIGDDDNISITIRKKSNSNIPSFDCIVGNMEYKTKIKGYDDLYLVLQNLSSPATWLWWGLLQVRNRDNNMCFFAAKDNLESKKITKAYSELHSLSLVKRVTKQNYLISPRAYLPTKGEFENVLAKWNELTTKETQS